MKWTNHQDLEKLKELSKPKKKRKGKTRSQIKRLKEKEKQERFLARERQLKIDKQLASQLWNGNYQLYLKSPEWKTIRKRKLAEAGYSCQLCNSSENLQIHHRTYERIFMEDMRDLTVLCENCHHKFHSSIKYDEMTVEAITKIIDDKVEEAVLEKILDEFYPNL